MTAHEGDQIVARTKKINGALLFCEVKWALALQAKKSLALGNPLLGVMRCCATGHVITVNLKEKLRHSVSYFTRSLLCISCH
jgi:hypothetical protein